MKLLKISPKVVALVVLGIVLTVQAVFNYWSFAKSTVILPKSASSSQSLFDS